MLIYLKKKDENYDVSNVKNTNVKSNNKIETSHKKKEKNDVNKSQLINDSKKEDDKTEKNVSNKIVKSSKDKNIEDKNKDYKKHKTVKKELKKDEEIDLNNLGLSKEEKEYNLEYFDNKQTNKKEENKQTNKKEENKQNGNKEDKAKDDECEDVMNNGSVAGAGLGFVISRFSKKEFKDLIERTEKYLEALKTEYSYLYEGTDKTGLFSYEDNKRIEHKNMMKDLFNRYLQRFNLKKILFESDMDLDVYFYYITDLMYNKYKNKIYYHTDKLGLSLKDMMCFTLEFREKMKYDTLFDKEFFFRENYFISRKLKGYKLLDFFVKTRREYFWFLDKETKINVLVILFGENLKHVIFLRNPNEIVLKEAEKVTKIEKHIDKYGIRFISDDINEWHIKQLYPCLKEQYFYDSKNILFIVRDSYEKFTEEELDIRLEFEHFKYRYILNLLRNKLFHSLYDDDYPILEVTDDKKDDNKNQNDTKIYKVLELDNEDFFKNEDKKHKYVAQLTYNLDCDARFKDIFNLDSEYLNKNFKDLINEFGYKKIEVKPQDLEDVFTVKFYGDDEKFTTEENLKKLMDEIMKNIIKKQYDEDFFDSNIVIKRFKHYLNDSEELDSYYKDRPDENRLRRILLKKNKTYLLRSAAVGVVDWSEKYRGYLPMIDLIIKSFGKFKLPFSNKVIDIEENYIEDYVLRVYENMRCGVETFEKTIKKGPNEVKVFKNII